MGLYLRPVTAELGIGREAFRLAIANIVWGSRRRSPARSRQVSTGRIVVFGAVTTVAGLYVTQAATSELHLFLAGVLLGFGVAGAGINALVGAVARAAPPEQRSAAIPALGIGSGVGILVALPYTHVLIEALGWKEGLVVLAATAAFILPLAWPLRGRPAMTTSSGASRSKALAEAFRTWLLAAQRRLLRVRLPRRVLGTHLPAYVTDQGLGPESPSRAHRGRPRQPDRHVAGGGAALPEAHRAPVYLKSARLLFLGFHCSCCSHDDSDPSPGAALGLLLSDSWVFGSAASCSIL
jgi:hypothetical protein